MDVVLPQRRCEAELRSKAIVKNLEQTNNMINECHHHYHHHCNFYVKHLAQCLGQVHATIIINGASIYPDHQHHIYES